MQWRSKSTRPVWGVRDKCRLEWRIAYGARQELEGLTMPRIDPQFIDVDILTGDARTVETDVLAVKSGAEVYGVTLAVLQVLETYKITDRKRVADSNTPMLINGNGHLGARQVLFQPVPRLSRFEYAEIREFSKNVLRVLAKMNTRVRTLALTLHGIGYGLDEVESFRAEVAGLVDAVEADLCPPDLERVVIIEAQPGRVERLRKELARALPHGIVRPSRAAAEPADPPSPEEADLRTAGIASSSKPYVFVAMPFSDEYSDVFEYGIQNAVRTALNGAYLCERADLATFTGDVMAYVRKRIEGAALVIADLTSANANVYLEIGYAWGSRRNTVLIVNAKTRADDVKFDLRGQRYLEYKSIKDLETRLASELRGLSELRLAR